MKNFKFIMKAGALALVLCLSALASCSNADEEPVQSQIVEEPKFVNATPEGIAGMLASLPFGKEQVVEVWNAVTSSAGNGYDEEYTFADLLGSPGKGVGDKPGTTRAGENTMRGLIYEYASEISETRSETFLSGLSESGLQIYWPYSEDWDGSSMPVVTFDPENGSESNIAFERVAKDDGTFSVREIMVDEEYAKSHPVWVVNHNDDAGFVTPQMMEQAPPTRSYGEFKTLVVKEFKAHRNFDSWFCGGSEFFVKCGALESFRARTEEEMEEYSPHVTDFMIKVRRKQVGRMLRFNAVLVSEWSSQLTDCAFLVTEDDGGKMTKWTASGAVKIKSRSYGFEVEFPYHRSDDIVWRGSLSDNYLLKNSGKPARYGDVSITFDFK